MSAIQQHQKLLVFKQNELNIFIYSKLHKYLIKDSLSQEVVVIDKYKPDFYIRYGTKRVMIKALIFFLTRGYWAKSQIRTTSLVINSVEPTAMYLLKDEPEAI